MDAIELNLFNQRLAAICDEMGARLTHTAFSPNIRERLDFSCAVFDDRGRLASQAAHIPVHLGSMAYALRDVVARFEWSAGNMLVFNAPWFGGTHLPDITLVAPAFVDDKLAGFVANRAHHADIGAKTPGSMPLSESLDEEGTLIEAQWLVRGGSIDWDVLNQFVAASCNALYERGDYAAQISACRLGSSRLSALVSQLGLENWEFALREMNAYAARLACRYFSRIPIGDWRFTDHMETIGKNTGGHERDLPIQVTLKIRAGDDGKPSITADFDGSSTKTYGNLNCPLAVTISAVYYVFRCLLPEYAPSCHGTFQPIAVRAPAGLINAPPKAAVAGGNVETSSRIVDCVLGALGQAMPEFRIAASQGTMNNFAAGSTSKAARTNEAWSYYETIGGGTGASDQGGGCSAVQSHMTNTRNTSVEELEMRYPLRVARYAVRRGSGGAGRHRGGDGIVRSFEFLAPATVTLLTERRCRAPWGAAGGADGARGRNLLNHTELAGKTSFNARCGDRLTIMTPGGGGWGSSVPQS